MNPVVSVIIPVFNGEKYLEQALSSVIAQTYRPLEIVLIDDGSTDKTSEIIERFQEGNTDRFIRFVSLQQANQGISSARNNGIEASTGHYVAFCDSDDLWEKFKLERQIEALQSGPYPACTALIQPFWSEEIPVARRHNIPAKEAMYHSTSNFVIERDAFDHIGGFREHVRHAEWIEWMIRARESRLEILLLPEVLAHRRIHETNNSRAGEANRLEVIKAALERKRCSVSKQENEDGVIRGQ